MKFIPVALLLLIFSACSAESEPALDVNFIDNVDCRDVSQEILPLTVVEISINGTLHEITAETAITPAERSRGLMCRESLGQSEGMLFVYSGSQFNPFWMFNTYFPIDIAYLNEDGKPIQLKTMTPCPRTDGESRAIWRGRCATEANEYSVPAGYHYALEVEGGWFSKNGVETLVGHEIEVSWELPTK